MTKFPRIDMPKDNPTPASPIVEVDRITPRDFFAGLAMQAFLTSLLSMRLQPENGAKIAELVRTASFASFDVADAMMSDRNKEPKK